MATKKTTKKAAKKTVKGTKRAYNRKSKPVEETPALPLVTGPIPYDGEFARDEQAVLDQTPPNLLQTLQAVEAIDMRPLNVEDRFAVLVLLSHHGYLASDGENLLTNMERLMVALKVDVLRLQHTNRLVTPNTIQMSTDVRFLSVPTVSVQAHVEFGYPRSAAPSEVVIGGEIYTRCPF